MTLQDRLKISPAKLDDINSILLNPDLEVIGDFLKVVEKYGTPEEINAKAEEARKLDNLLAMVKETKPEYLVDLEWLSEQADKGAFITVDEYRANILDGMAVDREFNDDFSVTLEISACQYFPWVRMIAEKSIQDKLLMPGRFIRVRQMKEQEKDGDLPAFAAAMQIIGASYVETLDTKGTDGSNIHLGGPATITGYSEVLDSPTSMPWIGWMNSFTTTQNMVFARC